VIAITTRRAGPGKNVRALIEGGSYSTLRGAATVSYGTERVDVSFTAQDVDTDGFSAAEENTGNVEDDGYENRTFSGTADYRINENLKVFFAARSTNAEVEIDAFSFVSPFLPTDDPDDINEFDWKAARGGAELSLFDGRFVKTFAVQRTRIKRNAT
jgi:vitamin B12 transporter